jgi:hypothetical protein
MIVLYLLLAGAASSGDICAKLASDFEINERAFSITHQVNAAIVDTRRSISATTRTFSSRDDIREAQDKQASDHAKYMEKGNQITLLMIAHKCKSLPDHVTSPHTYE